MLLTCVCAGCRKDRCGFGRRTYYCEFAGHFFDQVIEPFVEEYVQGGTPNPCILCNRHIKFPALIKHADSIGAEYIATGHYAQVEHDASGRVLLKKGADPQKDQSYVLYILPQTILTVCCCRSAGCARRRRAR